MQVVFVHYHLNAGGVTQVIVNQLRALAQLEAKDRPERVGVLYGGRHEGWPPKLWDDIQSGSLVPFDEVLMPLASLDYAPLPTLREEQLAAEVMATLTENDFAPDDTLLHVHNHSLGKNMSWPGAVKLLAERGYRLLLEIHDFAEDFRPANYRHLAVAWGTDNPAKIAARQYPTAAGIHYATLTSRDRELLSTAGISSDRLHTLPNPVAEFPELKSQDEVGASVRKELGIPESSRLVVYPVRGIRRKNLGEMLLHAAISPDDTWHALTLAPENPLEIPSYERWQALSEDLELRCLWNTCGGGTSQFLNVLAASDVMITTSVAEGFGMVFLEAPLAGKPLVGRDLCGITRDFKSHGIQFPGLYESLQIPLDLVDQRSSLAEVMQIAYQWACETYAVPTAEQSKVNATIDQLMADKSIDFALLPSRFQEQVIRAATKDPTGFRERLFAANPELEAQLSAESQAAQPIRANAAVVRERYSLQAIGSLLGETYSGLMAEPQPSDLRAAPDGAKILEHFLNVDRVHAIRFEE